MLAPSAPGRTPRGNPPQAGTGGAVKSVLGLRRLWPWPWLGTQFSAALHAGRHGSRLGGCWLPFPNWDSRPLGGPAADWGFQREAGPRGSGAFPGWQGALDRRRGDAPGARAGPAAPTSRAGSVGTVRLAAPPFSRAAATPSRTSCKGISTFFLCSSCPEGPCLPLNSESGATSSGGARGTGGPGSQPSIPAPSPYPLCPRWMRHRFLTRRTWGRASVSSPWQAQALWGREGAPRSPRQVREGCVDSFSRGEQVAPRSGPFLLFVFYFETVFNAFI